MRSLAQSATASRFDVGGCRVCIECKSQGKRRVVRGRFACEERLRSRLLSTNRNRVEARGPRLHAHTAAPVLPKGERHGTTTRIRRVENPRTGGR